MSGYYEMHGKGPCWENYYDSMNEGNYDYVMNRNYWMRENVPKCHSLSIGTNCSFYGPKDVPRITKESFLQGRGQVANDKCPDADVIYLPESVFAMGHDDPPKCERTDLQGAQTRQPRSCFNISETDAYEYVAGMPGAWMTGYTGMSDFCIGCEDSNQCAGRGTNIQSREIARDSYRQKPQPNNMSQASYGSYDTVGLPHGYL
jgi:hypothetical protein